MMHQIHKLWMLSSAANTKRYDVSLTLELFEHCWQSVSNPLFCEKPLQYLLTLFQTFPTLPTTPLFVAFFLWLNMWLCTSNVLFYVKLVSAIFYWIFIFHQMIALQKLWKMFFISSKKLFSFSKYCNFCILVFPSFFPSAIALELDPRKMLKFMASSAI